MHFLIHLLTFFLPFALCTPLLAIRDDCPKPTSAKVTPFNVFTADINPTSRSAVGFTFLDEATGITTDCVRVLPLGVGGSPSDPDNYYPCNNTAVEFLYSAPSHLALREKYLCNGYVFPVSFFSFISPFCFILGESRGGEGGKGGKGGVKDKEIAQDAGKENYLLLLRFAPLEKRKRHSERVVSLLSAFISQHISTVPAPSAPHRRTTFPLTCTRAAGSRPRER